MVGYFDWLGFALFFVITFLTLVWTKSKRKTRSDFYLASGKLPWFLSGISQHVSSASFMLFSAYITRAYYLGLTVYIYWSISITLSCLIGSVWIMPQWAKLQKHYSFESPVEYLKLRYSTKTHQFLASIGVILELISSAGKYTIMGVLLNEFTGLPVSYLIIGTGLITILYVSIGGIWANSINALLHLLILLVISCTLFYIIGRKLESIQSNYLTMWYVMPQENRQILREPYHLAFLIMFFPVTFCHYNGGKWSLATKMMATGGAKEASRSGLLSAALFCIVPAIILLPIWGISLVLPNLVSTKSGEIYPFIFKHFLPNGFIGLALAALFSAFFSGVAASAHAVSAVLYRDLFPLFFSQQKKDSRKKSPLRSSRIMSLCFCSITMLIAMQYYYFNQIGFLIESCTALLGPTAIPSLLGLLPIFKHCGPKAVWTALSLSVLAFILNTFVFNLYTAVPLAMSVGTPTITSIMIYIIFEIFHIEDPNPKVYHFFKILSKNSAKKTTRSSIPVYIKKST